MSALGQEQTFAPQNAMSATLESGHSLLPAGVVISGQPKAWTRTMFSKIKAAWARIASGRAAGEFDEPNTPWIEYQGYRIRPTPYRTERQYQTAGIIEKNFPDGPKQHRFVRADTHHNRDDAVAFAISKAKQIIDLQGDRMFT